MHDDDVPLKPLAGPMPILRHFEHPVSLKQHLHESLDRLLDEMSQGGDTVGMVQITVLDSDGPWAGQTVMLALDLDPAAHNDDDP